MNEKVEQLTINGHVIGDKVGTKYMCFMVGENELHCGYYSLIQIDGRMMTIRDNSAIGGSVNATTRKEARKLAIEARDRIKNKALSMVGDEG